MSRGDNGRTVDGDMNMTVDGRGGRPGRLGDEDHQATRS
jgi:hypothetical protein